MVELVCDVCGFSCSHTKLGMKFAIAWYRSRRTKKAYCKDFGPEKKCTGILHSGLSHQEIENELQKYKNGS